MATQEENAEAVGSEQDSGATPSFSEQVSTAVAGMKQDESGKTILPDGLSEEVKYAANAERRRRDTESTLGKTRLQLKAQSTINQGLTKRIAEKTQAVISPEEKAALDELMYDDPEAWRQKMNEHEQRANTTTKTELDELTAEASQQAETEARTEMLAHFNTVHPDAQITDEVVKNDIPPRITNKLATGEANFEQFLAEAHAYLTRSKVVGGAKAPDTPNLGAAGGGANPSDEAYEKDADTAYEKTVF